MAFKNIKEIVLPADHWQKLVEHCRRKLSEQYLPEESKSRKAYGVIAGVRQDDTLIVEQIVPLKKNVRDKEPFKSYMDQVMKEHAVPSKNPFSKRGWMTDPVELKACYDLCDRGNFLVLGTYHMHIVPWENDPWRDTPTALDTVLAKGSGLFTFIISMVDPRQPRMRAFYEGVEKREVQINIIEEQVADTG
jgi:hypothetical protein